MQLLLMLPNMAQEEIDNFQMLDVGTGLMNALVHIFQEIKGNYFGLEVFGNNKYWKIPI